MTVRIVVCLCLVSHTAPAIALKFRCDTTDSANAVYHLACLAGNIACTKSVFERFWHEKLQWTPSDKSELAAWTEILKKAGDAAPPPKPAPYIGNYISFFPEQDAQHRVIRAAVESRSLLDFERRAQQRLSRDEAARLRKAIEHFRGRLRPWLQSTGRNAVKAQLRQAEKYLRNDKMQALAGEMAAFLEADLPAREVYVHAIPGPEPQSDAATATVVSNHVFVEVTASFTPDAIASVSLHETTHHLYGTAPAAKHLTLMQQFVQADVPHASAFYALLNEALACAVQALLGERFGESDEGKSNDNGGYKHAYIPRVGRSTVPVLKESLAKGSTLYQGFFQAYMREANRELGDDVANPKFFLSAAAILPTDKAADAFQVFLQEFQPVGFIKSDRWKLFSHLNLVFLVAYDELPGFSTAFPELASHATRRGFAYMGSREERASVCILAGIDAAAITDVVRAFAKLQSVRFSGLLLSID